MTDKCSCIVVTGASKGKYPDATALFQRSLSIRKGFFGVPHPDVAESLDKLAELEEIKVRTSSGRVCNAQQWVAVVFVVVKLNGFIG